MQDPGAVTIQSNWGRTAVVASPTELAALDAFLRGVERRALRMASMSTGLPDVAMDLVQDAMLNFVRRYGRHPATEWGALFHRVLANGITDWHRRSRVRGRWMPGWFADRHDDDAVDPMAQAEDPHEPGPLARLMEADATQALENALQSLPLRQRQAFLLRVWEGLDVAETALAMRCSQGSVKTHLWRAMAGLRRMLEDRR